MTNAISKSRLAATTTASQAHVKGFVTSYAKCWEHYEGYMQDPSNTIQGFIEECQDEADEQGVDIKLPAISTFKNKTAKLKQAGVIPERLKSDKASAVSMRKQRATSQRPKSGQCEQPDDSQSSPLITPEIVEPHVPDVESSYASTSISGGVSNVQSEMDSFSDRYDKDAVPLDTTDDGRADADHAEVNRLLSEIKTIFKRHYAPLEPGTFDGFHWTDFYEQFDSLSRTAEQYSRDYRRLNREHAEQSLGKAKAWVDSKFGDQGNRIGADDEVLRFL